MSQDNSNEQEQDQDQFMITEQELEIRLQSSYHVGRASCFENLEASFKREAGELFANGQDERAQHLREIAKNMRLGAKDARERQKVLEEHVTALEAEREEHESSS